MKNWMFSFGGGGVYLGTDFHSLVPKKTMFWFEGKISRRWFIQKKWMEIPGPGKKYFIHKHLVRINYSLYRGWLIAYFFFFFFLPCRLAPLFMDGSPSSTEPTPQSWILNDG